MTIEEMLAGESKNIEFKVQRPDKSIKYMKSVVAFANGRGGRIIFGVDDRTREVVGIPEDVVFQEIDAITNAISDSCEPAIIPDVYLQTVRGRTVIVAEISPGRQRPYYIKSMGIIEGTYIRVSGTSRPADRDLTAEMYYEDEGRSYDKVIRRDLSVSDEEIQDLCTKMKEVAIANAKSQAQKSRIRDVTKNVLLNWGLLAEAEDGSIHPTNGYVFLLGKDDFLSLIQCGMFKGTTRAVFVDKREYGGPLWQQIEDAFQFVLRNIRLGARLEGIYRQDIYELPPDSIRELIINAVMNCSFLQNSHIQVAVYDNRLEITSPGGLLSGVTLERMKEGYSKIRNRALAHAFSYMNLIEAWGSGIPKLMDAMREYGLREPEFIDMGIGFRVNLYRAGAEEFPENRIEQKMTELGVEFRTDLDQKGVRKITGKTSQETDRKTSQETSQETDQETSQETSREIILDSIRQNPSVTQKMLQNITGLSRSGVRYIMGQLQTEGILYRVGSTKKGQWILKKE